MPDANPASVEAFMSHAIGAWSRHDLAFAAAAGALAALGVAAALLGWEPFEAYPRTLAPVDGGVLALAAALVACALLPFADRRGVGR